MNKSKMVLKKSIALLCGLALGASIFTGCGKTAQPTTTPQASAASTAAGNQLPSEISMAVPYFSAEAPTSDNVCVLELEKLTGTKLNVTWIPNAAYNEKLNMMMASATLPQVVVNRTPKEPTTINSVRAGMFWEVGTLLKSYPNLSKLDANVLKNISVDGKVYALYRASASARNGIIYRKDWLDNLGLKEPKTIDELYNVIKAFTLNDPDKNGKNDTYGLAENQDFNSIKALTCYYGGPNEWAVDANGKFTPTNMTKEGLDAVKFMKRLYDEKLMNQDFAVVKSASDLINKGTYGMCFAVTDDAATKYATLTKTIPTAQVDFLSRISGPKGEKMYASGSGWGALFMFPKTTIKDEKQLKQILAYFDLLMDKKFHDLSEWGIEGRHYTMVNGVPTKTQEQTDLFAAEGGPVKQIRVNGGELAMKGVETPIVTKYKKQQQDDISIVVYDPTEPFVSATFSEKGATLKQMRNDQRVQFVMGQIDEAGWVKSNDEWLKAGGDKTCEEYSAEYKKAQAK